ncbi:4-(cytidine 5'-diphospho)-2-C-methyl-D-erythritol kinase [Pedobacter sp. Leaf176]|uniref:4-(cytidine 5'-diphospho)-2-C-methyl-D-erythritol kinase n=1 Tax=Pedobacter sp. Leaf176 TaxID=1736286 RepID=UPI0006FB4859|nr:4-(cytidine 5'-diphospho)-2-C-methyl-D-erythritol kinase [Pedobacter sp. Leaf176]KQR71343.1 4-diphosphocytidyl-2C-methyl-D-erythritol kinase [Pedobacter sp. Leaf176]
MLSFPNAKINLGLNITEKRNDGYHNLETVFYPVNIKDSVEITDAEFTSCKIHGIDIPGDANDNLCVKAYNLVKHDFDIPAQQINLLKNIPVGAGLGGGSADCAFLIKLLNDKFDLGLSIRQMEDYARQLGADCAFFIENRPVFAFNKGDEFEKCEVDLSAWFKVLVKPPAHVSTADAYALVKAKKPLQSLKEIIHLSPTTWKNKVINDFEPSVFAKYPQIHQIKTSLYDAGAAFALMSGSGSSVFAIFNEPVKLPELEKNNLVYYNI